MVETLNYPVSGQLKILGYLNYLTDYVNNFQLKDKATWQLFVNQFRNHTDPNGHWRGEFWGKTMCGATLTYKMTKDEELYRVLLDTVLDIISVQEENGRISSYPIDYEFNGWDMWGRKYVILGLISFYEIAKSNSIKNKIKACIKKQANYILKHIGNGKNKKSIFDTSSLYGAMNSCSILEPFVKLYNITGDKKYFDFSKYIVDNGLSKNINLIDACLKNDRFPYQFEDVKAYEMISCFAGLLEYYKITKEEKYLVAIENFVDKLVKSDYTIIGCCGCDSEFLDNSTITQTKKGDEIMQETCVTVTFMKLCAKLLLLTKNSKYAEYIEKSSYNSLYGSVNDTNQTMEHANGNVWTGDYCEHAKHEPFPFDSYSPLTYGKRGKQIAGFMMMQNGRSYGCCACIGSVGIAISGLANIMSNDNEYFINLYNDFKFIKKINNKAIKIDCRANLYNSNKAKIVVDGKGEKFSVYLRLPTWADKMTISVDGENVDNVSSQGYLKLNRIWNKSVIKIVFTMPIKEQVLNNMVAFTKGPITLARDIRLDNINAPVNLKCKNGKKISATVIKNDKFTSNVLYKIKTNDGEILLCDYASAGKNYDDESSLITVWQDVK